MVGRGITLSLLYKMYFLLGSILRKSVARKAGPKMCYYYCIVV